MSPLSARLGALACATLYLPLGLVWAYGLALLFLPVAGAGFWLLRAADRREAQAGLAPTIGQVRLRAFVRGLLTAGLVASAASLALTK